MNLFSDPLSIITRLILVFTLLPIHEYAHAYVADKLGDPTSKHMGRLTLNPMAHVDPIGAIMLVLTGFGFAKSVPVNPSNFRNPKRGMGVVAAAGPLSNIIVSFLIMILAKLMGLIGYHTGIYYNGFYLFLIQFLLMMCYLNISLAVFNLMPIPPLDGSRIIALFLPDRIYYKVLQYERYIGIALFILLYIGVLNLPISWLSGKVYYFLDMITFFIPDKLMMMY